MTVTLSSAMASQAAALAHQSFCSPELARSLPALSCEALDRLDFGVVKVDAEGGIEVYNRYEQEFGRLTEAEVQGKNFFGEIAVCTNNPLFRGLFKAGIAANNLNHLFPYTFTYRMSPTPVRVHLYRDQATSTNWILVKKI